jgi:hypothetical protein
MASSISCSHVRFWTAAMTSSTTDLGREADLSAMTINLSSRSRRLRSAAMSRRSQTAPDFREQFLPPRRGERPCPPSLRSGAAQRRHRAPVLRPARDVVAHRHRPLLAVGDGLQAVGADAAGKSGSRVSPPRGGRRAPRVPRSSAWPSMTMAYCLYWASHGAWRPGARSLRGSLYPIR